MSLLFSWKHKGVSVVCIFCFHNTHKRMVAMDQGTNSGRGMTHMFALPGWWWLPALWGNTLKFKAQYERVMWSTNNVYMGFGWKWWHGCQECAIQWKSNFKRKSDTSIEVVEGIPGWEGIWELDRPVAGGIWTTLLLSIEKKRGNYRGKRFQSRQILNIEI